jgi:hypothetical protein
MDSGFAGMTEEEIRDCSIICDSPASMGEGVYPGSSRPRGGTGEDWISEVVVCP